MKWLILVLITLLIGLQYRLWIGEGSLAHNVKLQSEINKQKEENNRLLERNRLLEAEIAALKNGYDAIEEKARNDLGMIKEGETWYMIVDQDNNNEP